MRKVYIVILFFFSIAIFSQNLQNRVLVIKNINSPISIAIADDYMTRRNVSKFLNVSCQDSSINSSLEYMNYTDFITSIKNPLIAYLNLHPEIDFIVFTKGIPIHFYNFPNQPYGGVCSIDSYVSSFGYETNSNSSIVNISDINYGANYVGFAWANKYYNSTVPFSHATFGGYLVTRLDGYTLADAIALTTRSLLAEANIGITNTGKILLDSDPNYGFPNVPAQPFSLLPSSYVLGQPLSITQESPFGGYNTDMQVSNTDLLSRNILVENNTNATFVGNQTNLNGYYSWGSNDTNYIPSSYNSLFFNAGAIAETCVSTSARTFLPTVGGQSLIADLISQGVTGVKGYTDEPLLQAIASPSILFNRYTTGWTLAESFYAASRLVGWMDIVIGDPICRAYATNPLEIYSLNNDFSLIIYPNPCKNNIYINSKENCFYTIHELNGRLIKKDNVKNQTISIEDIKSGIYLLSITYDEKSFTKKIVKQ